MIATPQDHQLAADLATETGELLVKVRAELVEQGITHYELKDAGDAAAHELIVSRLAEARPNDAVLSEEGARSDHL